MQFLDSYNKALKKRYHLGQKHPDFILPTVITENKSFKPYSFRQNQPITFASGAYLQDTCAPTTTLILEVFQK